MSDKNELSRRGFMGMLAAIGLAPTLKPEHGAELIVGDEVVPEIAAEAIAHPPIMSEGTRLTFQLKSQWLQGGRVLEMFGPSGLAPAAAMGSGVDFTVAGGTTDVTLLEAMVSGEKVPFRLSFETDRGNFWEFHGYVTNWSPTFAEEGEQTVTISIDIAGDPQPCFTVPADS
jgi:hypothetical protein